MVGDLGWVLCPVIVAFAAAVPGRRLRRVQPGLAMLAVPVLFAALALGLLVWDHYHSMLAASLFLASACVLTMIVRMALTFRENVDMLRKRTHEAETDALTGLHNRRRLMGDLDRALHASPTPTVFRALRPQRLQAVQRRVRPPGRRRSPAAPRPQSRRCRG